MRRSRDWPIAAVKMGTTVATNAVLKGKGARVGLVTTAGYEQTLQVARSFCPGGLGGWVTFNKNPLLAPLELTIGADERIGANGEIVRELDESALGKDLTSIPAFCRAFSNTQRMERSSSIIQIRSLLSIWILHRKQHPKDGLSRFAVAFDQATMQVDERLGDG